MGKLNYVFLSGYKTYIKIDTIEVITLYKNVDDDYIGFISSESANYQYDITKEELEKIRRFINLW